MYHFNLGPSGRLHVMRSIDGLLYYLLVLNSTQSYYFILFLFYVTIRDVPNLIQY